MSKAIDGTIDSTSSFLNFIWIALAVPKTCESWILYFSNLRSGQSGASIDDVIVILEQRLWQSSQAKGVH